jgi:hypothetical protein
MTIKNIKYKLKNYLIDFLDFYKARNRQNDKNRTLISIDELEKSLNLKHK